MGKPLCDFILSFEVSVVETSTSSSASLRLPAALASEIASYPSDSKVYKNLFWTGMRLYTLVNL